MPQASITENPTFGDQITSPVILPIKNNSNGGDGIFWAKLEFYFEKNSPKVSRFEQFASLHESLNYSEELWTGEVTYSHLSDFFMELPQSVAFSDL